MKIGFLITARLKSTRLPMKIIMDLNGKTVIERIIDRVKEINDISDIVVCTSTNPQDLPLKDIAIRNNVSYFLGDEDDVIKRLMEAAKKFQLDYFIGITADNPLITIKYSNKVVEEVKTDRFDFIKIEGLPLGAATYGVRVNAVKTICAIKNIVDTEIWGYLINRPEIFKIKHIQAEGKSNNPGLRFTLDYPEDFEFITNIYSNVPFDSVLDLNDVFDYLDKNPQVVKINKDCIQRDLDKSIKDMINENYLNNYEEIIQIKNDIYSD